MLHLNICCVAHVGDEVLVDIMCAVGDVLVDGTPVSAVVVYSQYMHTNTYHNFLGKN